MRQVNGLQQRGKGERLHRVLSRAGLASRRAAERLILEGRITVNGSAVSRPGVCIDPLHDAVKIDGKRVDLAPGKHTYMMLNKPGGFVTTLSDPQGRPVVGDLLRGVRERVYPVGRLDFNTEGLLLLTNDGELARDLMHPRKGVTKTYLAKVRGQPTQEALRRLRQGIRLDGRKTLPARARVVRPGHNCWLEVTVVEGRKHQVRRMLESVGHPLMKLRRTRFDGLSLGRLAPGQVRPLTRQEVLRLRLAGGLEKRSPAGGHRP